VLKLANKRMYKQSIAYAGVRDVVIRATLKTVDCHVISIERSILTLNSIARIVLTIIIPVSASLQFFATGHCTCMQQCSIGCPCVHRDTAQRLDQAKRHRLGASYQNSKSCELV
jgi:hypothetical protein